MAGMRGHMRTNECDNTQGQLTAGLILMTIGFVLLMDRLDIFSFREAIRTFWPMILIWIGVTRLVRRSK